MAEAPAALTPGRLSRWGFTDTTAALTRLAKLEESGYPISANVLSTAGRVADPDAALAGLDRLFVAVTDGNRLSHELVRNDGFRTRLLAVLGASTALTDHLTRHEEDVALLERDGRAASRPTAAELRRRLLEAVDANPAERHPVARRINARDSLDALRRSYRRELLRVAAHDLTVLPDVSDVAGELADLAAAALEAALAIARQEIGPESADVRLAVIGMGKCGGRELNYVSDVDVVYVVEPAEGGAGQDDARVTQLGDRLAAALARACSAVTGEGSLWEVDANLRPEGKAGPLTRTLDSHVAYYRRWAKTWEFQALLKARPVAGDLALGQQYVDAIAPLVWAAAGREDFVSDVQLMRRRVEQQVPRAELDRQLKLGPGGLRDVEFAVQLLQLVHGRSDSTLRVGNTLAALDALARGGYVGREDAASLSDAYRFLRTLEHRLQLRRLRRTHLMPQDERELRVLARSVGFVADPVTDLTDTWRTHAREVRRLHEKLFYRPLLVAVARLDPGETRLTPEAAQMRLEALGYRDPNGALGHIRALTEGVTRRAAIQRTLLPVMLEWFADAPDADAGLLAFRRVSEALGNTHWYLALLRDAGATAERLARVLASSRLATDLLLRSPEAVSLLAPEDGLRPRPLSEIEQEMRITASRAESADRVVEAVRAIRRRELFRLASACALRELHVDAYGAALTDIAEAAINVTLDYLVQERAEGREPPGKLALIGMGRFGGRELSFGSDLDILFVHEPTTAASEQEATAFATKVASDLVRLLRQPAPEPPIVLDADLRPEGKSGPLARSLGSYRSYYERWSLTWESQALLRARVVAGDATVGRAFLDMIDPLRWPAHGLMHHQVTEVRRIKARVESERLPRGADPALHTKLGPGGLADVEWCIQLMQMRFAHAEPALRTTRTLDALEASAAAGLLSRDDATALRAAWLLATHIRDAIMVAKARASDSIPRDRRDLALVAGVMGYPAGNSGQLVEDYRRSARRARAIVERVFYS